MIRRREFIAGIGAAALPLAARAQQTDRLRRIAVLLGTAEEDAATKARLVALRQRLMELGWVEGRNLRIDVRFAAGDRDIRRKFVAERTTSPQTAGEPSRAAVDATPTPDEPIQRLSASAGPAMHRMDGRLPAARRPGRAPAISMLALLINADCVTQHYGQSFD